MEHLSRALSYKDRAAGACGLAVGALLHRLGIQIDILETVLAVAGVVPWLQVFTTAGANEISLSLWMIRIEPVATDPTLEDLNVVMAIINHIPGLAFIAQHRILPTAFVLSRATLHFARAVTQLSDRSAT